MLTGLVQSLGTSWGLARHYWVLAKLLINIVTTVVLLLYLPTFAAMAAVAAEPGADLAAVRNPSPVIHAGAAMVLLLLAAALSVYKPRHYPLRLATPTAGTRWQPPHHRKGAVTRVEIALADHPPPGPLTRRKGSASLADSAAAISTCSAASTLCRVAARMQVTQNAPAQAPARLPASKLTATSHRGSSRAWGTVTSRAGER